MATPRASGPIIERSRAAGGAAAALAAGLRALDGRRRDEVLGTGHALGNDSAAARFGRTWDEFRAALAAIRRDGFIVTRGEIDPGRVGIGVPVFDKDRAILGSLSFALSEAKAGAALIERLTPLTLAGARDIERIMNDAPPSQVSSARLRVAR